MGAPGQTKLWGAPNTMIFREAINLSSEASELLGRRGPEKRPLYNVTSACLFGGSAYLNNFNTICWCGERKNKIVLNFVVENNNLRLYARASEVSEHLINMHIFKSQKVKFLYELLLAASAISTIILFCHQFI